MYIHTKIYVLNKSYVCKVFCVMCVRCQILLSSMKIIDPS